MRRFACLLPFLVLAAPAQAAWRQASSDNFIVYSDGSETELVNFTQRVERFDRVLRIMTGLQQPPAPVKVRIYLVDSDTVVREMDQAHRPNTAGFYASRVSGGIAVVDREKPRNEFGMDGDTVLFHEYSHHYMAQYFPAAYPIWYQEGFAEYFASTRFNKDAGVDIGKVEMSRLPSLYGEAWLSTQQLMTTTLDELPQRDWSQFYAQGWLLTHYLFSTAARHDQFQQYLRLRTQGAPHEEALQKAFNLTDAQLGAELHKYFDKGKVVIKRLTSTALKQDPKVTVRVLGQPESECLLLNARVELGVSEADAKKLLEQVRAKAQHFAGDPYTQVMQGEAEARYGDAARARDILQAGIAASPDNRTALLDLAELELQSEQPDHDARLAADRRARSLAAKANRLDPNDPQALYLFYLSFAHEEQGPSQNAIDALAQAYNNLPQFPPLALTQARQDLRDGHSDRAVAELKPIAYSPHGGKYAQKMRAWIQEIEAKKAPQLADATGDETSDASK
jgi:tetratricopeptide (TPR) repeat protein